MTRRITKKFYFSVEGETEIIYLEWLENTINQCKQRKYDVSFDSRKLSPLSFIKRATILEKATITHVFDYESKNKEHQDKFKNILKEMSETKKVTPQKVDKYKLGYSNFTFELWVILHKDSCNGHLNHRNEYLDLINKAYRKQYLSLDEYKKQKNFQKMLNGLTLTDVKEAIKRARLIMSENKDNGYTKKTSYGYQYYDENPSLLIHDRVNEILKEVGLD